MALTQDTINKLRGRIDDVSPRTAEIMRALVDMTPAEHLTEAAYWMESLGQERSADRAHLHLRFAEVKAQLTTSDQG